MNCGGARRLFGAYWDDETTLAERDCLEAHFSACAACRAEYEQFARTIELVGSLPRLSAHPELAERALVRARRAASVPDRLPQGTPRWIPVTATAALLAIAATMALQWVGVGPSGRNPQTAQVAGQATPGRVEPARADRPAAPIAEEPAPVAGLNGAIPDSLFDHSADVEFILDPVVMHKGRAHQVLKLNPAIQGEKAVITF
jgi:anti-sigma factor RsiW